MPIAPETDVIVVQPQTSVRQRLTIYGYIAVLFFAWPFAGIWGTSASFTMKDHLHMSADAIAGFLFIVNIPAYFGFIFGFIRDRWGPFGRRDQGLLMLFCGLASTLLFVSAGVPVSFASLLVLYFANNIFGQFIGSALRGLTSVLGQEHVMSGRIASVWQAASSAPGLVVYIVAGHIAKSYTFHQALVMASGVAIAVTMFSFWRPKEVYDAAETAPIATRTFSDDVRKLVKTRALYPIVLMLFFWNFTPGAGTAMQFYLTNNLHGDATDWGNFNAIFGGFFIPGFLLFGFLCSRVPFRPLVWICTFIAVPQILPLLMVHNVHSAMVAAVFMGLMGGPATAAYFGLLIRACPAGLQGTAMMLGASAWVLSDQLGNLTGSALFDHFKSFAPCAWTTVLVYACLIPVMCFVPKHLTATKDGEIAQ